MPGHLTVGMPLARITHDGEVHEEEARYLTKHQGLEKIDVDEAEAGSIVVIAGTHRYCHWRNAGRSRAPDPPALHSGGGTDAAHGIRGQLFSLHRS